ncbi:spexin prohormone 2 [Myripristis murdjan]|uniref:spexin prohormone 2 n=1 Tax=Myripristis murdjan TaxID=586833 RepID=UPI001175F32B|nr:protein lin-54 homolog [Myripristis murdjan]
MELNPSQSEEESCDFHGYHTPAGTRGEPLPVAIICAPELMGSQEFQDGQADVVVSKVSGDAQVVTSHCQPFPILHTLAPPPAHRDMGPTQGKEMNMLVASNQHHQTASPVYCETTVETASLQLKAVQTDVDSCKPVKSKKPCNCVKSQCLKLYCDCFANLEMCRNCNCSNCYNNEDYEKQRLNAIQVCLNHNPSAFKQMTSSGKSGEVKGGYNKGCKCKRSGCLKKYCKCYEANIMCTASCECVGCVNSHDSTKGETRFGDFSETSPSEKIHNDKEKCLSVITPSVVEAVCGCLLSRAQLAERDAATLALAEQAVLEEFGQCLAQISEAIFKPSA